MVFEEIISIKKGKIKHVVRAIFDGEEVTAAIAIPDYCAKALIMDWDKPYSSEQIQNHEDSVVLIAELIIEDVESIEINCPECEGVGYLEEFVRHCGRTVSDCCGGCTVDVDCPECEGRKTVESELIID